MKNYISFIILERFFFLEHALTKLFSGFNFEWSQNYVIQNQNIQFHNLF